MLNLQEQRKKHITATEIKPASDGHALITFHDDIVGDLVSQPTTDETPEEIPTSAEKLPMSPSDAEVYLKEHFPGVPVTVV